MPFDYEKTIREFCKYLESFKIVIVAGFGRFRQHDEMINVVHSLADCDSDYFTPEFLLAVRNELLFMGFDEKTIKLHCNYCQIKQLFSGVSGALTACLSYNKSYFDVAGFEISQQVTKFDMLDYKAAIAPDIGLAAVTYSPIPSI